METKEVKNGHAWDILIAQTAYIEPNLVWHLCLTLQAILQEKNLCVVGSFLSLRTGRQTCTSVQLGMQEEGVIFQLTSTFEVLITSAWCLSLQRSYWAINWRCPVGLDWLSLGQHTCSSRISADCKFTCASARLHLLNDICCLYWDVSGFHKLQSWGHYLSGNLSSTITLTLMFQN